MSRKRAKKSKGKVVVSKDLLCSYFPGILAKLRCIYTRETFFFWSTGKCEDNVVFVCVLSVLGCGGGVAGCRDFVAWRRAGWEWMGMRANYLRD